MCGVNKSGRLAAINCLSESAMKKSIFYVQLMDGPLAGEGNGEHCTHGGWLDHWTERLIIVDIRPLGKAPKNPVSLVSIEAPFSIKLVTGDPFSCDDISSRRTEAPNPKCGLLAEQHVLLP